MVFAHAYIFTRMMGGTSLANQNVACFGYFASKEFNA
jgi:hypothetical protein